jgi:hypothetical protein
MNSNWDEKRIRQLFVEARLDDARRAPDFGALLKAGSRESRSDRSVSFFALAAAIAALVVIVGTAIILVRRTSNESPNDANSKVAEIAPPSAKVNENPVQPKAAEQAASRAPVKRRVKHIRVQRTSDELAIVAKSFSAWQSPTASLLTSPGEVLLRQLPKVGDSLQTLGAYSLDQLN